MIRLLRAFDLPSASSSTATWELAAALCYYSKLYGAQIVLVALLSAMTVYRREMSCNHVYNEEDEAQDRQRDQIIVNRDGSTPITKPSNAWDEEKAEELLEGVGNYCSGSPLLPVALSILAYLFYPPLGGGGEEEISSAREDGSERSAHSAASESLVEKHDSSRPPLAAVGPAALLRHSPHFLTHSLPPDLQIHALSYLPPKDIVTLACVSRSCRSLVEDGSTSQLIWRTLWHRDYAWLVRDWDIGRQALARSHGTLNVGMSKTFYFVFGQAYTNYILAGCNTSQRCLVSLHGNMYDLTPFLQIHPGSPDTLLVHAGREATRDFERMNHSAGARRLALSLCVAVDSHATPSSTRTNCSDCGVHPTRHTTGLSKTTARTLLDAPTMPMGRRGGTVQTLHKIKAQYEALEAFHTTRFRTRFAADVAVLGGPSHMNAYYDPFQGAWMAWYTNTDFETVFVS